ncbi:hypothetical protein KL933_000266 [Ogataea haglerorum]|uniref:ENTH domain-containing protein n=1 Tax=Ogataea haglerorum TaxID=1937702 RepID=A0AAN6DAG8_9ASCO|nr:hypothetical protein KL951_000501 [Ogataea haglerorum]KAG7711859.1 hypothetical protein KL914_000501 [Ogataea haglerorum]KAG7712630.1 hypothetical protein KL950_000501 [Ogataea haglerorum]KAG7722680.1 hypothetical protein KL913_000500 [Ogataea haglerorum]KAG7723218.1 hypothetical protein KL949_000268 [Ogataea haglerorum]
MSSYSLYDIRQKTRKLQNGTFGSSFSILTAAFSGYSNLEILIREATNTDPWGPTSKQKKQLCSWILNYANPEYVSDHIAGSQTAESGQSISKKAIDFIVRRIQEYSGLGRGSQGIFDSLKKTLVTRGYEFVIVSKCLQLLEHLLLYCYQEDDGVKVFDIVDDIRIDLDPVVQLEHYRVTLSYDGLDLNHEKQIKEMARHVVELATDESKLAAEREKFQPRKQTRQNSGTLFYDEDQFDVGRSDALRLEEDQDPFAKSRISALSSNVARYLPGSPGHRKSRSSGRISLASQNYTHSSYHDDFYDTHDSNDENSDVPPDTRQEQTGNEHPDASQNLLIDLNS